jgi:hypothetical protein
MQQSNDEPETDFAVMRQQHEEFLRRLQQSEVQDILGVVSASGVGGAKVDDSWRLVFHFDGWCQPGLAIQPEELRIEMAVSEEELLSYMAEISAYDILHVRGRVALHPAGRMQAGVEKIVSTAVNDAELEVYAGERQKPVVYQDPRFGTFTLNRSLNWFSAELLWAGQQVRLNLSMDDCDSIVQPLALAAKLWNSEAEWNTKIIDYAVENLLPLKNDVWLEEDEVELSAEDFKNRMSLEAITIYPLGSFEFWYDDGDLFWGHSIMVSGSLAGGLADAGIHG